MLTQEDRKSKALLKAEENKRKAEHRELNEKKKNAEILRKADNHDCSGCD